MKIKNDLEKKTPTLKRVICFLRYSHSWPAVIYKECFLKIKQIFFLSSKEVNLNPLTFLEKIRINSRISYFFFFSSCDKVSASGFISVPKLEESESGYTGNKFNRTSKPEETFFKIIFDILAGQEFK